MRDWTSMASNRVEGKVNIDFQALSLIVKREERRVERRKERRRQEKRIEDKRREEMRREEIGREEMRGEEN